MTDAPVPGTNRQAGNRRRAVVISAGLATVVVLVILAVVADFFISQHEASVEVHQLCGIINLVASKPVPKPSNPSSNPSRVDLYDYYIAFKQVQHKYGC